MIRTYVRTFIRTRVHTYVYMIRTYALTDGRKNIHTYIVIQTRNDFTNILDVLDYSIYLSLVVFDVPAADVRLFTFVFKSPGSNIVKSIQAFYSVYTSHSVCLNASAMYSTTQYFH